MLFTSLWALAAGLFPGSRQRMNESVFSRKLASSRTLIVDCDTLVSFTFFGGGRYADGCASFSAHENGPSFTKPSLLQLWFSSGSAAYNTSP